MAQPIRQTAASTRENVYWPQGTPRGGIVCLHGSGGGWAGWNDLYCALFAANGFAALSRNYTQQASWPTPPDINNVPLEGTRTALAAMRKEIAPFRCGVGLFGISRGAEHALLLAQLLAEDGCAEVPDAVAVHSPPDVTWPAFIVSDFLTGQPWAGIGRVPLGPGAVPTSGPSLKRRSAPVQYAILCSSLRARRTEPGMPTWPGAWSRV